MFVSISLSSTVICEDNAGQLQLSLFGLGGLIGSVVVDTGATIEQVKDAMVEHCRLPS